MTIERRALLAAAVATGLALPVVAMAGQGEDAHQRRLREDWPWLGLYAADNVALQAAGTPVDIVFMGDSITEGWRDKRPSFFPAGFANRGIGGQTTSQMVLRMMADVVHLRPRFVHVMAGTNDIAGNTGPMTTAQTCDNLAMMATIARANGIGVLLASVPPAGAFPWRPGLETAAPIRAINAWIAGHARATGATFVDYTPVLATAAGAMRPGLAYDGVHPGEAGYDAMAGVLTPILRRVRAVRRGS